jgi:hypothetical protein
MKYVFFSLALLLATTMFAQQPGPPSPTGPPQTTPPTFPEGRAPRETMPPDQEAPPPQKLSTKEVQQQIEQGFSSDPMLRNSSIAVHVDQNSVILTGTVSSEQEHDRALRIAKSYAGDRKIDDKITVKQQA